MNPYAFAETHADEFVEQLKDWLRIPSVSTLSSHKPDIRRAAEWVNAHLAEIGISRCEMFETAGNPLVYAEWLGAGEDAPTVLIYGHYDVQPADDPDKQWKTAPFEPVVQNGNLYARGATDDKGQTFTQIKAIQALLQEGALPVNVKFLIEGEEESGSTQLYPFVEQHTDLLKADVVVISDTSILGLDRPSIVYGLRGLLGIEIIVRGPAHDLHSGIYGGAVHNPLHALADILSAMHDADGRVAVPGFYDKVRALSDDERAELAKTPFTLERLEHETGVRQDYGEPEYAIHERLGARPTFEINGLVGGWIGEGGKTVLPMNGTAKITCRLVPDQDPLEIFEQISAYVTRITPPTVTSEVQFKHKGLWAIIDRTSPYMQAAVQAYEDGFGARPVFMLEGGSVPIVGTFQKALNAPVIMMGFGLPDDNLHAPNEKFSLACFARGIKTAISFYQRVGALD